MSDKVHLPETIEEKLARLKYHPPRSSKRKADHRDIESILTRAMRMLLGVVPNGREQSLMMTKLEEARMWANAGLARSPDLDAEEDR